MKHPHASIALFIICCCAPTTLAGDVIVLANRTGEDVSFAARRQDATATSHDIPAGQLVSLPVTAPLEVHFGPKGAETSFLIDPNSVCVFHRSEAGALELNRIGFAAARSVGTDKSDGLSEVSQERAAEPPQTGDPPATKLCIIPVKIFVDDEEPLVRKRWEARLRARMKRASDILEQHCRVRFEVVAADTWDSDNEELNFAKMLAEFEREVRVKPAALAIGFSSQRRISQRRTRLGATFAPLRQFILIREWSKNMGEGERLEVLLHELGHYLGATHSPENDSIMRPMLNDGRANLPSFHIGFDPVNTLIMCLVGEEIRDHNVRDLQQLTPKSRRQLKSIYREIANITPDEPATVRLIQMLDAGPREQAPAAASRSTSN